MTTILKPAQRVPGSFSFDAIDYIENITGPGSSVVAQQSARQHVMAKEAATAIATALGEVDGAIIVEEMAFEFGGL